MKLALAEDAVLAEQLDRLGRDQVGQAVDRVPAVGQPAALGLGVPGFAVIVAVEDDVLALLDQRSGAGAGSRRSGPCRRRRPASRWVAISSRLSATIVFKTTIGPATDWLDPTARNSNLLPVKANGLVRLRSPGSRGRVGRTETPILSSPPVLADLGAALFDLLDDVLEHVAQEDRDDRRRGLVGAQPVVVVGVGDRDAQAGRRAGRRPG